MATLTLDSTHFGTGDFFKRVWSRYEEARKKEAQRRVRCYLQTLSDDQLEALSFNRHEISELKTD